MLTLRLEHNNEFGSLPGCSVAEHQVQRAGSDNFVRVASYLARVSFSLPVRSEAAEGRGKMEQFVRPPSANLI